MFYGYRVIDDHHLALFIWNENLLREIEIELWYSGLDNSKPVSLERVVESYMQFNGERIANLTESDIAEADRHLEHVRQMVNRYGE